MMETIRTRFGDRYGLSVVTFRQIRGVERGDPRAVGRRRLSADRHRAGDRPPRRGQLAARLVLDRIREIGLLVRRRTRRQIVRSVVLESAIVGLGGGVLGGGGLAARIHVDDHAAP